MMISVTVIQSQSDPSNNVYISSSAFLSVFNGRALRESEITLTVNFKNGVKWDFKSTVV